MKPFFLRFMILISCKKGFLKLDIQNKLDTFDTKTSTHYPIFFNPL